MNQTKTEKHLAILYVLCTIAGAIACITSGIAWGHWKQTLDQCVGRNCSCILYGEHTRSVFLGGGLAPCIWVTFGPIVYFFFTVGFAGFHGYRVLFAKTKTRTIVTRNEVGETVQMHAIQEETTSPLSRAFWIILSIFTAFFTFYALVHFSIFMDGYLQTCRQYKRTLERDLNLGGTALPIIHNRLSCNAIFDFMDYMLVANVHGYREGFIQTGIDLSIGLVGSFMSWVCFAAATFCNVRMSRVKE